jgi:hypothetical protein
MITGRCSCGAIQYEADGEPLYAVLCYCRDCQRASGTGHVPVMGVPKASFRVCGITKSYTMRGTSGLNSARHFCPVCGSLLFGTPETAPEAVSIYVGTLDDPSIFEPTTVLFTRNRPAWDRVEGSLVEFEIMPPLDREEA